jgi:WD40 repeat protein
VYIGFVGGRGDIYDLFLSYSRADAAAAETVRARLREVGLRAFLDRYGLPAGQLWQPWLENHLRSCRALIVLVGPLGFGEWQHREIQLGLDRQAAAAKTAEPFAVIPVLLPGLAPDAVPVGSFLSLNTWVDLRSGLDDPESLQRLIAGAQGRAIDTIRAKKLLAGLTPYRGLLPFREQDSRLFFGRERFVEELVRKVRQRSVANVVAVIGRSGSGKSSIVYAGLFPALRREKGLGDQSVWKIVHLRPYAEPLQQLAAAFDPPKAQPDSMEWLAALNAKAKLFRSGEINLAEVVRARLTQDKGSTRVLLYVDQWEELYTLGLRREMKIGEDPSQPAKDVKLFIDLVLEAAAKSPSILVLSARSDFYPDIQDHDALRIAVQESQVSLGTMNQPELRAVIEGPPKMLGASVDPNLTEKLIRDIGFDPASGRGDEYDIGKLPLLEYALEQAWGKRTGPRIGLEHYSGLEQALEERANALYGRLSAEEQLAAKRLFVSLVTPGEGHEDTRARIDMPDDDAMRRVIQSFAAGEARLVVTDEAAGHRSVEVSHEALIRHWDRLRGWIDENRDKLRTREFLKTNRAEWIKHGRDPGLLGLPSLYIEAARSLYGHPGDVVTDDIRDYVEALLDHDWKQKDAEDTKQREELKAARRLASERAKSEEIERGLRLDAEEQRLAALRNQAAALTALSNVRQHVNPALAAKFALAAWPRISDGNGVKLDVTVSALSGAVTQLRERRVLRGHTQDVLCAAFSPDGSQIVTASQDKTARLWDVATSRTIAVLAGHREPVSHAAFSLDGIFILTASTDGTVRIWDTITYEPIGIISESRHYGRGPVFSQDGARVVTAPAFENARLWDAATGKPIAVLGGRINGLSGAAFSRKGERVVTMSGHRTARLWDARTGKMIAALRGHERKVLSASFSPDSALIVTTSEDQTARIWTVVRRLLMTSSKTLAVLRGHEGWVLSAVFSPDGTRIVTASDDKTARIWDTTTLQSIAVLSHEGPARTAVFSPDGRHILTASDDGTARIWDGFTGKEIIVLRGHDGSVCSACFSPDGACVVTASEDGLARTWDVAIAQKVVVLRGHAEGLQNAAFSPDGARVVTVSADRTARLWDAFTTKLVGTLSCDHRMIASASFSPDGAQIVTASDDGIVRVWDVATKEVVARFAADDGWMESAAFSPNGLQIVTAAGATARIWDVSTCETVVVLSGHRNKINDAAFSPDGKFIVTASNDNTALIWDVPSGQIIGVLSGHVEWVSSAAFSPEGSQVVTSSRDRTARVSNVTTGTTITVLRGHAGEVMNASFSPDGARVITASADGTARIWDLATGQPIAVLGGHAGTVRTAAFSRDGARVLTASVDKTARIWDISSIPNGNLFQIACAWLPDHDLTGVAKEYGLANLCPICEGDPPLPDRLPQ